jgi:DNA-binding transcriptional ArsR family regulator
LTALEGLRLEVLRRLAEGRYPAAVAQDLGLTRQVVQYHVRCLLSAGFLHEDRAASSLQRNALGGGPMKLYGLTDQGHRALGEAMSKSLSPGGLRVFTSPRVEVHNFQVKLPIRRLGIQWLPNAAAMQNWQRRWDPDFHGVYLEVTPRHVLLRTGAEGADREEAEGRTLRRLFRVMQLLESHYACEFGPPEFQFYGPGKGKVGVLGSPLAKGLPYQVGQLAMVDSTPEPGTVHPADPADADRIVQLARNVEETKEMVDHMARLTVRLAEAVLVALGHVPAPPGEQPRLVGPPGPEVA